MRQDVPVEGQPRVAHPQQAHHRDGVLVRRLRPPLPEPVGAARSPGRSAWPPRARVRVPGVRAPVQQQGRAAPPHERAHRGAALQVRHVRQGVRARRDEAATHGDARRREDARVHQVREAVPAAHDAGAARTDPLGRAAVRLHGLWRRLQAALEPTGPPAAASGHVGATLQGENRRVPAQGFRQAWVTYSVITLSIQKNI